MYHAVLCQTQSDGTLRLLLKSGTEVRCRFQLFRNEIAFLLTYCQVLQGEGNGILPGYKKTKVVIQMLKEDADHHDQFIFLQEGSSFRF